ASKFTTTTLSPGDAVITMSLGQVIDGGCTSSSITLTVKEQFAVPATFEAVQLTVVTPPGKLCGDVITVAPMRQMTDGIGSPDAIKPNATLREQSPGAAFVT